MTAELNATRGADPSSEAIDAAWAKTIKKLNSGTSAKPTADASADEPAAADRPDGAVSEAQIDAMWAAAIAQTHGGQTDG